MIRLCYSNRTEELLGALAADLAAARAAGRGLFEPVPLVVPNPQVETYVKLGVARQNGIAANLRARHLRAYLADVVAATDPTVAIVDRALIEGELLALLHDDARLAFAELAEVRAYLVAGGDARDAVDLRRAQLAAEIAELFDQYAFARPELLRAWRQGRTIENDTPGAPDPERRAVEAWQRGLWLALFGRAGAFERRGHADGRRYLDLPATFASIDPRDLKPPATTYVFGLSYVARLYRDVLAALGRASDVHLYALNPCREYWEDLEPARRSSAAKARFPRRRGPGTQLTLLPQGLPEGRSEGEPETPRDPPALTLWARPGRENIQLLNQLSDCDFVSRFVDPLETTPTPTVLAQLQRDILDRAPLREGKTRLSLADDSVAVLPCPDPRRELETVAAEIWRLAGPERRFTDFAVIVPPGSAELYLPLVEAVFREASELPAAIVDRPDAGGGYVVEAVSLLLDLPLSPLGRPDLLRLLMHPRVAARCPDADPRAWLALAEELDVVRGADHEDHAGSYVEGDRFNWDQGLRRLALGSFLSGPRSGQTRGFAIGDEVYLPAELSSELEASGRALALLARGRLSFAKRARESRLTIAEWMTDLRREIAATIVVDDDAGRALPRVHAALERIEAAAPSDLRVGYRVARELVVAELARLPSAAARVLTQGVTVSTFLPMRAVPFRVVFLVGMGEGRFPARETPRELDLRAGPGARRVPGDVSPREQDQYMFLEALLCARERLAISYVDRDEVSGEPRTAASTVVELLDMLDAGYVRGGRAAIARRPPPLRRHEDDAACGVIPAAARERRAARLGAALERHAGGRTLPEWPALRPQLAAPALDALGPALDWAAPREARPSPGVARERRRLTTRQLLRFLQCPLQGSARVALPFGIDELDDEAAAAVREHEDFDLPWSAAVALLRDALRRAARPASPAVIARAVDEATALARLDGTLPNGTFAAAARSLLVDCMTGWEATFAQLGGLDAPPAPVFIGDGPEHRPDVTLRPALRLRLPPGREGGEPAEVELHGETSPLGLLGGEPAVLLAVSSRKDTVHGRERLSAFVDHVALAAGEPAGAPARRLVVLRPGQDEPETVRLRAVSREDARAYLERLAGQMLSGVHAYFFPCEAVLGWRKKKEPRPELTSYIQTLRDADWKTYFSSDWGPVPDATEYPLPRDEATARRLVDERFGLYFEAVEGGEA